jgi:hypothetical protein
MALNAAVSQSIVRHLRSVTVKSYTGESVATNGEVTDSAFTTSTKNLAILPLTAKELQTLGDGMYDRFDRKFYSLELTEIPIESIFETDLGKFKIMSIDNRTYEGGFIVYYTKKVIEL